MQHNNQIGALTLQRSNTMSELYDACSNFLQKMEEERQKILSIILPVAILVSAGLKGDPQEDPIKILTQYNYDNNPNAQNVVVLAELFDLYEYTEGIKAMISSGEVSDSELPHYEDALNEKLEQKEIVAQRVSFATLEEIDHAFATISNYEEECA